MNCKFAPSGLNSKLPVCAISKPSQLAGSRFPESVSFASQVSRSRVSISNAPGPNRIRNRARVEASYAVAAESPYQVLGIEESVSSVADIKKAYKKMARKYHPDVSPPERVDENTRRFIMVKEAYETLSNPQRRAVYDRTSGAGSGGHHQGREERGEWKVRWQCQVDELKRRSESVSRRERMSWGARMRSQA